LLAVVVGLDLHHRHKLDLVVRQAAMLRYILQPLLRHMLMWLGLAGQLEQRARMDRLAVKPP
tara:strand:- start:271 stop:456 length:186 start_codon:yes stop_codon:yes gene_type:complete